MTTGTTSSRFELAKPGEPLRPREPNAADELLRIVRSGWRIIAAAALAGVTVAWIVSLLQPNRYRSTSIAAVTPVLEALTAGERIRAVAELDQRVIIATIAALAETPVVSGQALAPAERASYAIRAVALPNTNLLRVEVDGPNAARAAAVANRVPGALGSHTRSIFKFYDVAVVSPAASGDLVFPRVSRTVAAGLMLGVIFGIALAWVLDRFRLRA